MALVDEEERRRAERAHQVALFRYQLIREAADAALNPRQRGVMVRAIAARTHTDPFGKPVRITRGTVDRWLRLWREGGFDALLPPTRQVTPRTPEEVLDLAAALKRETRPGRPRRWCGSCSSTWAGARPTAPSTATFSASNC
ncbi:helix-turn-helix domain-containing protein [Streptomyces mirabilis]